MAFDREIDEALAERIFVRIEREGFEGDFVGVVQSASDSLLCLAALDDRVRMGGFDVLRRDQIGEFEIPAPHADFYESALRLRGERKPDPPPLDLASIASALESISRIAPLVVVHREEVEPDVCEIGQVVALESDRFCLREIDPDADWVEDVAEYPYDEVTRLGFGGDYEAALALVAGLLS